MARTLERRTTSKIKPTFDFFFSANNAADFWSMRFVESSSEMIPESVVVIVAGRERRMGVTRIKIKFILIQ